MLVRFQDGQATAADRIVGLQKWEKYDTGELLVSVNTLDGALNFKCATEDEQDSMLLTISKQLERYLDFVDLMDIDFVKMSETAIN